MGKYRKEILEKTGFPTIENKVDAVRYEWDWTEKYIQYENRYNVIFQDFFDRNIFVGKHNRTNMVIENDFLIKYKSMWDASKLKCPKCDEVELFDEDKNTVKCKKCGWARIYLNN